MLGASRHLRNTVISGGGGNIVAPSITNLTATSLSTSITITWQYNPGTTGVTTPTFTIYTYKTSDNSVVGSPGSQTTKTFTKTGLTANTEYLFEVLTNINSAQGNYNLNQQLVVSTSTATAVAPSAPSNFAVVSLQQGAGELQFSWNAANGNGAAITNYKIESTTNFSSPSWSTVATVGNVTSYNSSIPIPAGGVDVLYKVSATNGVGYGPGVTASAHAFEYTLTSLANSGTWTVPAKTTQIKRLLLCGAGGGGGAYQGGGGGGAGEVVIYSNLTVTPGTVNSYNVGTAGAGGTTGRGSKGGNTTFGSFTANGGGGGGGYFSSDPYETARIGESGGSGGGGSRFDFGNYTTSGGASVKANVNAQGVETFGNAGAPSQQNIYYDTPDQCYGGGGGGAGGAGAGGATTGNTSAGGSGYTWTASYQSPNNPTFNTIQMSAGGSGGIWYPNNSRQSGIAPISGTVGGGLNGSGGGGGSTGPGTSGKNGLILIEYYK